MKLGSKGHASKIEQPDIARAFQVNQRLEKFDLKLSQINAHTLRIIEIIDEEKTRLTNKKQREIKKELMNNAGR